MSSLLGGFNPFGRFCFSRDGRNYNSLKLPSQTNLRSWTRHSSHWIYRKTYIYFLKGQNHEKSHGFLVVFLQNFPSNHPLNLAIATAHRAAACCQSRLPLADSLPRAPARTAEGHWALKSWLEYRHLPRHQYPESIVLLSEKSETGEFEKPR